MTIDNVRKAVANACSELYIADLNYSNLVRGKPLTRDEHKALELIRDALTDIRIAHTLLENKRAN